MSGCYGAFSESIEEGYLFRAVPGSDWMPKGVVAAIFHGSSDTAPTSCEFSIWSDVDGEPGKRLATFLASDITDEEGLCFAALSSSAGPLKGGQNYWLIGSTDSGYISWLCDRDTYSAKRAHRKNGGAWVTGNGGNAHAFTVYGEPVGERAPE